MLVSECLELKGKGIHTGKNSTVLFEPREKEGCSNEVEKKRIRLFLWRNEKRVELNLNQLFYLQATNNTRIRQGEYELFTSEHLVAAMLPFVNLPIDVVVIGDEVPGLDGSSFPFFEKLKELQHQFFLQAELGCETFPSNLKNEWVYSNGFFNIAPNDHFSVDYTFHRGDVRERFKIDFSEKNSWNLYEEEIIPARTFISWKNFVDKKGALLNGVDGKMGILFAENKPEFSAISREHLWPYLSEYPYLNRFGKRMENEFAKHKILDLMGDLGLMGLKLPRLKLTIKNGGHHQNHLLIKDLFNERNNNQGWS